MPRKMCPHFADRRQTLNFTCYTDSIPKNEGAVNPDNTS